MSHHPASRRRLTLVLPLHNESDNVAPLVERVQAVAAQLPAWDVEMLFVDDGSTDDSILRLQALRAQGVAVGFLRLSRNYGHAAALEAGLQHAEGDAIITMDADLQHPPEDILRMMAAHEAGADVVQMVRARSAQGLKGLLSRNFYRAFALATKAPIVPNAADFRLLSRCVVDVLNQIPEREKFLRGMIPSLGFRQITLPYNEAERLHGTPSFSFGKSLKLANKALFDFSTLPLKLVFWVGTGLAMLSFLAGVISIAVKLIAWHIVTPGYTDIIVSVLFLSGCILASVGVLGRYLIMILEQVRGRPTYVVMEHARGATLNIDFDDGAERKQAA